MSGPAGDRLRSVDVFRGITMAAMVIVNNPGDWGNVYAPLLHAEWHGLTPTDLIFPFFLFIVGTSTTLSATSRGNLAGVLRRGATIFGLGLFLAGFPFFPLSTWRIPGVLQRIAVCYVTTILIVRATAPRDANARRHVIRLCGVATAILVAYAVLLQAVPVPDGRAGDLSAAGNLGAWLDRRVMGGHLWRPDWDPEGLLSTLPAIATTLLGVLAGLARTAIPSRVPWTRILAATGAIGVAVGASWHPWFPVNKALWTSSYVLVTAGAAALLLAMCSRWADGAVRGLRQSTTEPFVALGRNAILLFVVSGIVARLMGVVMVDAEARVSVKAWVYSHAFAPIAGPKNASLLFAIANLAVLYAVLAWLHRRRWYWRV
jgi:predicted acyltransferase